MAKAKRMFAREKSKYALIAFGHGETQGAPHKNKPLQAVCNRTENMPEWFLNGMEAALLAPTAMNQQKFFSLNCFLTVKSMRFAAGLLHKTGFGNYKNIILR